MKMRRFFAADMPTAMQAVRDALGDEAVILSNRRTDEGIELMVAVEYDPSLLHENKTAGSRKRLTSVKNPVKTRATPKKEIQTSAPVAALAELEPTKAKVARAPTTHKKNPYLSEALPNAARTIDWTKDPVLASMQTELRALRGLLEDQLAGLVWGNTERQSPTQALIFRRLSDLGLEATWCRQFAREVAQVDDAEQAWKTVLDEVATRLKVIDDDILRGGGIIALVGPPGVGKTTTIAKLAARFSLHYGPDHVALLTTDTHRIAALEQLRIYGKILGITVKSISDTAGMRSALRILRDKRLILLDTAGMSQDDFRIREQFSLLKGRNVNLKNYLVLPATSQHLVLKEAIRMFSDVNLAGAIITKLDECRSLGPLLSVLLQSQLPVAYMTDGQRVPEDIHVARAQTLLANAVAIAQENQENKPDHAVAMAYGRGVVDADI